jgi:hypothetical protein
VCPELIISTLSKIMRVVISLFLLLAVLLWNPVVVVEAQEEDSVLENGEVEHTLDGLDEPAALKESLLPKDNGIIVLESLNKLGKVFQQEESKLILTLVHSSSCPHSLALLNRVEEAYRMLTDYFETATDSVAGQKMPSFAKLDAINSNPVDLQNSGVSAFPTLVFVTGASSGYTTPFLLEYTGRQETAEDIHRTVLHYFYQLVVASAGDVIRTDDYLNVKPKHFDRMKDVTEFLIDQRHGILANTVVEPGFPSTMSAELQEYISWLMFDEDVDDFVLIGQCRNGESEASRPYYKSFDHMVLVVSSRRDRLFVTLSDCGDTIDGSVVAWKIPIKIDLSRGTSAPKATFSPSPRTDQLPWDLSLELIEFVVKVSTPSLLWFDRQATAPIAFPKYRKVHAVLFVDLHHVEEGLDRPSAIKSRDMIRRFRHACREHSRNDDTVELDMVCLVVPSTETRVLTTFGIDIWTVLDERVRQWDSKEWAEPLPALMLTDQRSGGTKRYYLDSVALSASNEAISDFFTSFWQGRLTPRAKSSKRGPRTNASGVRMVTGDSFRSKLLQAEDDRHALIFFSAPTCGHCKRFSILWNRLAELIAHIEWDSFLTLYQMDVTTNEIIDLDGVIAVRWLPDVYYFSPHNRTNPVRYDVTDEQGEGVGRLGSPLEILQWLIQEGEFDDAQLQQLLLGLHNIDETTAK